MVLFYSESQRCSEPVSSRFMRRFKSNKEYHLDETKRVTAVSFGLETYPGIAFENGSRGAKETECVESARTADREGPEPPTSM